MNVEESYGRLICLSLVDWILLTLSVICQFHSPASPYQETANRVVVEGMLMNTQKVHAFVDVDWVDCIINRSSTLGYCDFVGYKIGW